MPNRSIQILSARDNNRLPSKFISYLDSSWIRAMLLLTRPTCTRTIPGKRRQSSTWSLVKHLRGLRVPPSCKLVASLIGTKSLTKVFRNGWHTSRSDRRRHCTVDYYNATGGWISRKHLIWPVWDRRGCLVPAVLDTLRRFGEHPTLCRTLAIRTSPYNE